MYCMDCVAIEQVLINYNYDKDKCLNLSKKAYGGITVTKDFPNIEKLLKIIHIDKVAKYYKISSHGLRAICKEQKIPYINTYKGGKFYTQPKLS